MPNQPKTQHRSVRVDTEKWERFHQGALVAGTDRAKLINAYIDWYLREPGAKLPDRPPRTVPESGSSR